MSPQKIAIVILLVSLMLQTGLQVNVANLLAVLRNYGLLGRAFLANFIIVPVLGVALVRLFHLSDDIATGILLMAIAPGVPFVPFAAGHKKGGSLGFAICLAFLMPAISIVTVPITAPLVLPSGAEAHIPGMSLIVNIVVFQLLPLLIGLTIAQRAPELAGKLIRPVNLLFIVTLLIVLALLLPQIVKGVATVYGSRGLITALLLVLLSIATGWVLGGTNSRYRYTAAIGTALRNVGLALLVATGSFPGTGVAAMVMSYFIIQIVAAALSSKLLPHQEETAAPAAASG